MNPLKIEHIALQVEDPRAMAAWYIEQVGMQVVRDAGAAVFLGDATGQVILELYHNETVAVPDYAAMDPLLLHVAFASDDPPADASPLIQAGATQIDDIHGDNGDRIIVLRDPWGLAIQLAKRAKAMR